MKATLRKLAGTIVLAASAWLAQAQAPMPPAKIRIEPRFRAGEVVRYRTEILVHSESSSEGLPAREPPERPLEITVNSVVRLEVLAIEADGAARLRATFEKFDLNAPGREDDAQVQALKEQYARRVNKAVSYRWRPVGGVDEVKGLEQFLGEDSSLPPLRDWLRRLTLTAQLPAEPVAPGEQWTREVPLELAPLPHASMTTESTYVRNENFQGRECAVIRTRFTIQQKPAPETPATPGRVTMTTRLAGSGESFDYLALDDGRLLDSTETSQQEVEMKFETPGQADVIALRGRVRAQAHTSLLPAQAAPLD